MSIKVTIVDDSAVMRQILKGMVSKFKGVEIVDIIGKSTEAESRIQELKPDVVLLDIEMPEKTGLEILPDILTLPNAPYVIMVSSRVTKAARQTIQALSLGASDYIAKPSSMQGSNREDFEQELELKIRSLINVFSSATAPQPQKGFSSHSHTTKTLASITEQQPSSYQALGIGCSTGGPRALQLLLSQLPTHLRIPVLVTQHMSVEFTEFFAQHLTRVTGQECRLALEGDILAPGRVYLAPGGLHMTIIQELRGPRIHLDDGPPQNFCKPSVNPMMSSLAHVYGKGLMAVILTGMGHDGLDGCREVADLGGTIYVQDQNTSVIWGMPGAVANAGLADKILPLEVLANLVTQKVSQT